MVAGPSTSAALFSYNVDAVALSIPLVGNYLGDNACCAIASGAPTITPAAPAGLFTLSADNLTNSVHSTDISTLTGPGGGYYTLTYTIPVSASGCFPALSDTTYDVEITNLCGEAVFAIDQLNSIFLPSGTPSASYIIVHSAETLSWDSSSDY